MRSKATEFRADNIGSLLRLGRHKEHFGRLPTALRPSRLVQ